MSNAHSSLLNIVCASISGAFISVLLFCYLFLGTIFLYWRFSLSSSRSTVLLLTTWQWFPTLALYRCSLPSWSSSLMGWSRWCVLALRLRLSQLNFSVDQGTYIIIAVLSIIARCCRRLHHLRLDHPLRWHDVLDTTSSNDVCIASAQCVLVNENDIPYSVTFHLTRRHHLLHFSSWTTFQQWQPTK